MQHYPSEPYSYGNGEPQGAPSRVTAVIAAVLATITGLLTAASTIFSIVVVLDVGNDMGADDHPSTNDDLPDLGPIVFVIFLVIGAASALLTLLYLPGGLLLFLRRTVGRVLVIIASVLATGLGVGGVVMDVNIGTIAATAVPAATLVLAALPSTGRWIAADKAGARAVPVSMQRQ